MDLESGRLFERLLNPAEGLYPKIGNITSGSGFSLGPGYRHAGMFGGHADFSTFAAASLKRYWMIDARLQMPRLANNRAGVERVRAALRLSGRGLLRSRTGLAPRERSHLRPGQHRLRRVRHLSPDTVAQHRRRRRSLLTRRSGPRPERRDPQHLRPVASCPARWRSRSSSGTRRRSTSTRVSRAAILVAAAATR